MTWGAYLRHRVREYWWLGYVSSEWLTDQRRKEGRE